MSINNFAVFQIEDAEVLKRQMGGHRRALKMDSTPSRDLVELANAEDVFFIGRRENFHGLKKVSIEYKCQILELPGSDIIMRHTCDMGGGSSGAALIYWRDSVQLELIGVNYGDAHFDGVARDVHNSDQGNFFIPSEHIIKTLDQLFPPADG